MAAKFSRKLAPSNIYRGRLLIIAFVHSFAQRENEIKNKNNNMHMSEKAIEKGGKRGALYE